MMDTLKNNNPFPGLRAFEMEEEYLFFGREKQVNELLKKLKTSRFIAVLGASGSGKSSLVKCGLLPALYSGYMVSAGSSWRLSQFRPGDNPIYNLAKSLATTKGLYRDGLSDTVQTTILESTLRRSSQGLIEAIKQSSLREGQNILIVADQFEELFRFSKYEKHKNEGTKDSVGFVNLLIAASQQTDLPIYIAFTMRSDFLGDCTQFKGLPEIINDGQYLVPRMTREEEKLAITGPIAVGGGKISSPLVARLLNDIDNSSDQLPILQHALMRTWDYWVDMGQEGEPMDIHHYESVGTMGRALSGHAGEAYFELDDQHKLVCEDVFKALTEISSDSRGIRRPTKLSDLAEITNSSVDQVKKVVKVFRKKGRSFLTPVKGELNDDTIIDISHESLMRVWTRLIKWTKDEQRNAEIYLRLAEAAALYGENKSGLYRNPELAIALRWRKNNDPNQKWAERYDPSFQAADAFLDLSDEYNKSKTLRQEKIRKKRFLLSLLIAGFMSVALVFSLIFWSKARINQKKALASRDSVAHFADQLELKQKSIEDKNDSLASLTDNLEAGKDSINDLRLEALNNAEIAEKRADELSAQQVVITSQRDLLEQNQTELEKSLISTEKAKNDAVDAKNIALEEKKKANILRSIANANTLSSKSILYSNDNQKALAMDTAVAAYDTLFKYKDDRYSNVQNTLNYEALLKVWESQRPYQNQYLSEFDIKSIATHPSNKQRLAIGEYNGTVLIIEKSTTDETYKQVAEFDIGSRISALDFLTSDDIVIKTSEGKLLKYDLIKNKTAPLYAKLIQASPKSTTTKTALTSIKSMTVLTDYKASDPLVALSGENSLMVYHYHQETDSLRLLEGISKQIKQANLNDTNLMKLFKSKSGVNLATLNGQNKLTIWALDAKNDKVKDISPSINLPKTKPASALAMHPKGDMMAIGIDRKITLINLKNSRSINYTGHTSDITDLSFTNSQNYYQLASSSRDNTVRLWPIYAWENQIPSSQQYWEEEPLIITQKRYWINTVSFSEDDNWILIGGVKGLFKILPASSKFIKKNL